MKNNEASATIDRLYEPYKNKKRIQRVRASHRSHTGSPPTRSPLLDLHLDAALTARGALAQLGQQIGNVIPRVAIQAGAQALLVEEVGNQADGAAEDKEAVEHAMGQVVLGLFGGKGAAVAQQVDKADGHAAVDVENEVVLFARRHALDGHGVVEEFGRGEVGLAELAHEGDAQVGVVAGFDAVADAGDWRGSVGWGMMDDG